MADNRIIKTSEQFLFSGVGPLDYKQAPVQNSTELNTLTAYEGQRVYVVQEQCDYIFMKSEGQCSWLKQPNLNNLESLTNQLSGNVKTVSDNVKTVSGNVQTVSGEVSTIKSKYVNDVSVYPKEDSGYTELCGAGTVYGETHFLFAGISSNTLTLSAQTRKIEDSWLVTYYKTYTIRHKTTKEEKAIRFMTHYGWDIHYDRAIQAEYWDANYQKFYFKTIDYPTIYGVSSANWEIISHSDEVACIDYYSGLADAWDVKNNLSKLENKITEVKKEVDEISTGGTSSGEAPSIIRGGTF